MDDGNEDKLTKSADTSLFTDEEAGTSAADRKAFDQKWKSLFLVPVPPQPGRERDFKVAYDDADSHIDKIRILVELSTQECVLAFHWPWFRKACLEQYAIKEQFHCSPLAQFRDRLPWFLYFCRRLEELQNAHPEWRLLPAQEGAGGLKAHQKPLEQPPNVETAAQPEAAVATPQGFDGLDQKKTGPEVAKDSTGIMQADFVTRPKSWQEIEIAFLSDERVDICIGDERKTYNFGELGFEDRRNEKPSFAWVMLRNLAGQNGTLQRPAQGRKRASDQKCIQEIRKKLRTHFKIDTDPIPFNGSVYQTSFKIGCRLSSNT
jgi:hypothetical protein